MYILVYIFLILIGILILYFVIKSAVRNGVKSVLSEIIIEQTNCNNFIISSRSADIQTILKQTQTPLFDDSQYKSGEQKRIEKELYILYGKRKLPIDYNDTIENQKIAIRKIAEEKIRIKRKL